MTRIRRVRSRASGTALAAALLCATGLAGCGKGAAPARFEHPPALVTVATATAKDVPVYLDEIGRCAASEVVSLKPRVSGTIAKVLFKDGANVLADAPVFEIDPAPYAAKAAEAAARLGFAEAGAREARAARGTAEARQGASHSRVGEAKARLTAAKATAEQVRAEITAAEADAERAAADERRYADASASGAVSKMDLDRVHAESNAAAARLGAVRRRQGAVDAQVGEAEAAVKTADDGVREAAALLAESDAKISSADANVALSRAALETARIEVGWCSIKAPIAGRAGRRLVDVGNVVKADETVLVVLQRLDPVYVEFAIPERDLTAVQQNMAREALSAEVSLPDASGPAGEARQGVLTFLDNAVEGQTGTVALRATVANADERLWPGRFARVRLVLRTLQGAVLVPATAPQASAGGTIVLVAKADGTAEKRSVKVGQRQGDQVVVESGLAAGERVVVTGQLGVTPGGKLQVLEPAPAAPHAPNGMGESP